MAYRGSLLNL